MSAARTLVLAICGLAVFGCAAAPRLSERQASADSSASNTDPCAMRLHDICAPLLLYYATHRALPPRIEMLGQVPGFENVTEFSCPVSKTPYTYNPAGIPAPDRHMRLILYDAKATHDGIRWAISIPAQPQDGALVAKVVAVPETRFGGSGLP